MRVFRLRNYKLLRISKADFPMKYPVEKKLKWICPEGGGAPLLTMPNLPKPMHGLNPRTIMGDAAWNRARKRAYYLANYKSEISGVLCSEPGSLHAHEVYDINYVTGECTFKRVFAITPMEHVYFIHSGRAITLWKNKNPLYTTEKLLAGVENGFKLIYEWNKANSRKPKLKAYQTFLEYLKHEELREPMERLIEKYEIEFWGEDLKHMADWEDWKLVIKEGNTKKVYPTPYKDYEAWEEAMKERAKNDTVRQIQNPFTGGIYDEIMETLKKEL